MPYFNEIKTFYNSFRYTEGIYKQVVTTVTNYHDMICKFARGEYSGSETRTSLYHISNGSNLSWVLYKRMVKWVIRAVHKTPDNILRAHRSYAKVSLLDLLRLSLRRQYVLWNSCLKLTFLEVRMRFYMRTFVAEVRLPSGLSLCIFSLWWVHPAKELQTRLILIDAFYDLRQFTKSASRARIQTTCLSRLY